MEINGDSDKSDWITGVLLAVGAVVVVVGTGGVDSSKKVDIY
jgi:hypothetical protein